MDRVYIEKQLSGLFPRPFGRASRRRLRVYVETLDRNFYLVNPSGRPLSPAMKLGLSNDGVRMGWKRGATIWPREVNCLELGLMVHIHLWKLSDQPT